MFHKFSVINIIYILADPTNFVLSYKLFLKNILLEKNNLFNIGV
jgi:hypothetical protein